MAKIYNLKVNFDRMMHLTKQEFVFLPDIEEKLLRIRKTRAQPFTDKKVITSWNALVGIALMHAYKYLQNAASLKMANTLFGNLLEKHFKNGKLLHSSLNNQVQEQEFLEDYAAMLLFATYIYEESCEHRDLVDALSAKLLSFKKRVWTESNNSDFREVAAQAYDHPTPSSISLAELALLRKKILLNEEYGEVSFGMPLSHDFLNTVASFSQGNLHIYHAPEKLCWEKLPLNSMQLKDRERRECYKGVCRPS